MAAKAKVTGLKELVEKLHYLGEHGTVESIAYRATYGTSKDLRGLAHDNARQSTKEDTGALLRGFAIKKIKVGSKIGYTVGMRAGANRKKGKNGEDPWYWWLLEFGTRYVAPRGFFRRAFEQIRGTAPGYIIQAGRKAVLDSGNRALTKFGSGGKR